MKKPFYIPDCDHARILVNRRALYLLQQGGRPSAPEYAFPGLYADDGIYGYYYQLAGRVGVLQDPSRYHALSTAYVELGDQFEYIYTVAKCGHCPKCARRKQLDFVNRCAMESESWSTPAYCITLTYRTRSLPHNRHDKGRSAYSRFVRPYELYVKDIQNFFKRLRIRWDRAGIQHNIRYVVAGEYGSPLHTERPHFHIILWNNPYRADEFKPWLQRKLAMDIFSAWSFCDWQSFDCRQAGDGAAAYVSKYITKQSIYKLTHKPVGWRKPFILQSIGNGGIGAAFIRSKADFLRSQPLIDKIAWSSRHDGTYREVSIGSYAKNIILPSPSRQVPALIKQTYRELTDYYSVLVSSGYLEWSTAYSLLEQIRPPHLPHQLPRIKPGRHRCWLSLLSLVNRMFPVHDYLVNQLVAYRQCPMPVDVAEYYRYQSVQHPRIDSRFNSAGEVLHIRSEVANVVARSVL